MQTLVEQLRKRKDDRGIMADLRCLLVESKKHRAWPELFRLGVDLGDETQSVVSAFYATHPLEASGNLGTTCRRIQLARGDRTDEKQLGSTERRFMHLLASEAGTELHQRVLRVIILAKAFDIGINYEQLLVDLRFWNDRTKNEWAREFWKQTVNSVDEGTQATLEDGE